MKSLPVPRFGARCFLSELPTLARAEIAYQRAVSPPPRPAPLLGSNAYEAAAATILLPPPNA